VCVALFAGKVLVFVLGGCRLRVVSLPCWLSSPRRFLALLCGFLVLTVCVDENRSVRAAQCSGGRKMFVTAS
jgi:hypothetical protein